jgi:hypothetical protein
MNDEPLPNKLAQCATILVLSGLRQPTASTVNVRLPCSGCLWSSKGPLKGRWRTIRIGNHSLI